MRSNCPNCNESIHIAAGKKHQYCPACETFVTTNRLRWRLFNTRVCYICDQVPAWTIGVVVVLAILASNFFD